MGFAKRVFGRLRAREIYLRPHNWSFTLQQWTALNPLKYCCAGGGVRTAVKMFLVQADLNNPGVLSVGDGTINLLNGIQLDAGRAVQFSVGPDDMMQTTLFQTPMDWNERLNQAQSEAANMSDFVPPNVYLDMSNFFIASDSNDQRVRLFWTVYGT